MLFSLANYPGGPTIQKMRRHEFNPLKNPERINT
jgi:hypothetical protein